MLYTKPHTNYIAINKSVISLLNLRHEIQQEHTKLTGE